MKAALHKLAADVELATPAGERWCVNTEDFNESGRVYLELADAALSEAARGDGAPHEAGGMSARVSRPTPSSRRRS